jgi:Holliday junction resolvase RusA-like endonuclease
MDSCKPKRIEGGWMVKIDLKPLSVNECWAGRRFKTPKYSKFEKDLLLLLPAIKLPKPPYVIYLEWGFSNGSADWDNPIKPVVDILQKKYGFNDKQIIRGIVDKVKVPKGQEYLKFKIETTKD